MRCSGHKDPTRQSSWRLLEVFTTTNSLPHRSCIACHEIMDVTGIVRSEIMILTGLMIARMRSKTHLDHEVFPVCASQFLKRANSADFLQILMFSLYGSKCRLVQAHMSPESERLQVRYGDFFDFRELTQDWLDLFVRWVLSEPLAEPMLQSQVIHGERSNGSMDPVAAVTDDSPHSDSDVSRSPHRNASHLPDVPRTPKTALSRTMPSPPCGRRNPNLDDARSSPRVLLSA